MTIQSVNFIPSTISSFQFQPTIGGVQYNANVTWNVFGQRYYITITDLQNNLIICRSVVSSGPQLLANFEWLDNVAYVSTQVPHNIPVGSLANVVMTGTDSGFDGPVQVLSTGASTVTYPLTTNPQQTDNVAGAMSFVVNLVEGTGLGWLTYWWSLQQFQFEVPST
jgi:hypothetical protein